MWARSVGGATSASSNTVFIESGAGIGEGARTGLANLVTGGLFLAAMFITPLASIVPTEVAAAALVIVGALMVSQVRHIDISEFSVALPVFLTIAVMPFTYSIANGIGVGFIAWVVMRSAAGKARDDQPAAVDRRASASSSTSHAAESSHSSACEVPIVLVLAAPRLESSP